MRWGSGWPCALGWAACRVDSLRAQLSSRGSDAKQEAALEQSMRRLQHKESKLQGELYSAASDAAVITLVWKSAEKQAVGSSHSV